MNPETTYILNNPCESVSSLAEDLMIIENPMTSRGDMIAGGVAGYPSKVEANNTTTKKFLGQQGTGSSSIIPTWQVPTASEITNVPSGATSSTNVQDAINEIATDVAAMHLSDYVPYTGATSNIDLGSADLTTTGDITAANISNLIPYSGATTDVDLGLNSLSAASVTVLNPPVADTDATNKLYVDAAIAAIELIPGVDGVDGIDGINGADGLPGVDGADGADGAAGAAGRTIVLTATYQAFDYTTTGGTPSPVSSTVTATAYNYVGTPYYEFFLNDISVQNGISNIYTYTPQADISNMPDKVEVQLREDSDSSDVLARDQFTMYGLRQGVDAITVVLSNEAHVCQTSNAGVVDYTGSGTSIKVWQGTTALVVDETSTYTYGSFRVSASGTNITPGTPSGTDGSSERIYGAASAMTANMAYIDFTITVTTLTNEEITLHKLQSFSKSIEGAAGTPGADGNDGGPGPGVVYRGVYSASEVYYNNTNRRDIVQYSGDYYMYVGVSPSTPGAWNINDWDTFGANFSSVATDILFADLAYIDNLGVREFEGVSVGAGDLTGTVETVEGPDHVHYVAQTNAIWETTLASGSSGYCEITVNGNSQNATWNTSLDQTAADFVNNASYTDVTVTNPSAAVLRFEYTGVGDMTSFTTADYGISASPSNGVIYQAYVAAVPQKETITLSGTSGIAKIIVNGSNYYAVFNDTLTNTASDFAADNTISGIAITSSGPDIILTASPAASFTMGAVSNQANTFRGAIKISGNDIWEDIEDNDTYGVVRINYKGYNGGYTHKRITIIGGGKGSTVATIGPNGISGLNPGIDIRQGALTVPRYTNATTRSAGISSPENGMIVYMDDADQFSGYANGAWYHFTMHSE